MEKPWTSLPRSAECLTIREYITVALLGMQLNGWIIYKCRHCKLRVCRDTLAETFISQSKSLKCSSQYLMSLYC